MLQTVHNSKLKRGKYVELKQGYTKCMLLQDYIQVQFLWLFGLFFGPLLGPIFGPLLGPIFVAIRPFRVFKFLLTLIFGCRAIFVIWDFNYKICNRIPKSYEKYFYLIILLFLLYTIFV